MHETSFLLPLPRQVYPQICHLPAVATAELLLHLQGPDLPPLPPHPPHPPLLPLQLFLPLLPLLHLLHLLHLLADRVHVLTLLALVVPLPVFLQLVHYSPRISGL